MKNPILLTVCMRLLLQQLQFVLCIKNIVKCPKHFQLPSSPVSVTVPSTFLTTVPVGLLYSQTFEILLHIQFSYLIALVISLLSFTLFS